MKKTLFKNIAIIIALICLITAITGCSAFDKEAEYTIYYACLNDGELNNDDSILLGENEWFYGTRYGKVNYSGNSFVLTDMDGNQVFSGTCDGKVIYLNEEKKFFYSEAGFEDKTLSIVTVYAMAKNAGFEGTLEDLINAFKGDSAYEIAVKNGYKGTEEDWLASLRGIAGASPYIGDNGNWYIGNTDTGVYAKGEKGDKGDTGVGIKNILLTSSKDNVDTYTIVLTNGETYKFTVTNGKDGENVTQTSPDDDSEPENGTTIEDMYQFAVENGFDGTYLEFIQSILNSGNIQDNTETVNQAMLSSVSITASGLGGLEGGAGSGIIYKLDKNVGTAFIITNYHVVYGENANNEFKVCDDIKVYLCGSEINNGIDNDMGINAEFIGGSMYYDIAILKITNSELLKNSIARQAKITDSDKVYAGQSVYAVGNAEGYGISVTSGIVSMDSENIAILSVDEKEYVSRRVIRTDAPVNPGNSGGGLFDSVGNVVGIVSAKIAAVTSDGIGYAIPSNVAVAVAENILYQYSDKPETPHVVYRPLLGMTIYAHSSSAVVSEETNGRVYVEEVVMVKETTPGSLSDGKVFEGDIVKSVQINDGVGKKINRVYKIVDTAMSAKVGDVIKLTIERKVDGEPTEIIVEITLTESCMTYTK